MIGFRIVNLMIPGEPQSLNIITPSGTWILDKAPSYDISTEAIRKGQCAVTYSLEHPVSMAHGAAACDLVLEEITPLLLGASYLSGLSVTADQSLPFSEVTIMQPSHYWPRERAMGGGNAVVVTTAEFKTILEAFVTAWPSAGKREKVLIMIHHWLDSLACWSLEDLYLSATTLLQIIAATEESVQGKDLDYLSAVTASAKRVGIRALNRDFKDMRNNLIHEGKLLGDKFSGNSLEDCTAVAADVLNWFDAYMHSVLGLGAVRHQRFAAQKFLSLNAYSL
jgi:hypothetical protein